MQAAALRGPAPRAHDAQPLRDVTSRRRRLQLPVRCERGSAMNRVRRIGWSMGDPGPVPARTDAMAAGLVVGNRDCWMAGLRRRFPPPVEIADTAGCRRYTVTRWRGAGMGRSLSRAGLPPWGASPAVEVPYCGLFRRQCQHGDRSPVRVGGCHDVPRGRTSSFAPR